MCFEVGCQWSDHLVLFTLRYCMTYTIYHILWIPVLVFCVCPSRMCMVMLFSFMCRDAIPFLSKFVFPSRMTFCAYANRWKLRAFKLILFFSPFLVFFSRKPLGIYVHYVPLRKWGKLKLVWMLSNRRPPHILYIFVFVCVRIVCDRYTMNSTSSLWSTLFFSFGMLAFTCQCFSSQISDLAVLLNLFAISSFQRSYNLES